MATGLLGSVLGAFAFPHFGDFWVYLTLATRLSIVIYIARQEWGEVFRKLLFLGLVLGVFSIFPDYMLVNWFNKGKLIYPTDVSTLLLVSPAYAMLGWTVRIVEFGYLVTRVYGILMKRWTGETGLGMAMVVGGVSSAILLGSREFLGAHAGWWTYADAHALIGEIPGLPGLLVVSGFSGHGFKLGPAVGRGVAALISGGDPGSFDPDFFAVDRFEKDQGIKTSYRYGILG